MKRTVISGNQRIEYILFQAPRKNVLFQALPEGVTRVYAPRYMRLRDIDEMVRQRADQLAEMHRNMDHRLEEDRRRLCAPVVPCAADASHRGQPRISATVLS